MQIVRTLVWVVILAALLIFTAFNWRPVEVQIWTNIVLETKIPALVIVSFLLGLVPMWLIHRGTKWRLERRIAGLESSVRANAKAPAVVQEPIAPQRPDVDIAVGESATVGTVDTVRADTASHGDETVLATPVVGDAPVRPADPVDPVDPEPTATISPTRP